MPTNAWLALPCALISLLLTNKIVDGKNHPEKTGPATATKVASFLIIFLLTAFTTKLLIESFTPHYRGAAKKSKSQQHRNQVLSNTMTDQFHTMVDPFSAMQDPNWPFAQESQQDCRARASEKEEKKPFTQQPEDDRQAQDFQDRARAWEKKEEKRIRKMLAKDFKPTRNTLLGGRRESVVEVTYEPPSRTGFNGGVPTSTVKYSGGTTTRQVSRMG